MGYKEVYQIPKIYILGIRVIYCNKRIKQDWPARWDDFRTGRYEVKVESVEVLMGV